MNLAEFAVLDEFFCVLNRRDVPIVERRRGRHARRFRGVGHPLGVREVRRERFLTEDGYARLQRRDGRFGVDEVRPEVVEHVHLVDDFLPVRTRVFESETVRGLGKRLLVPPDERVAFDFRRVRKEHR